MIRVILPHHLRTLAKVGDDMWVFFVPRTDPGITVTVLKTIASDKQAEVVFKDVKVAAADAKMSNASPFCRRSRSVPDGPQTGAKPPPYRLA